MVVDIGKLQQTLRTYHSIIVYMKPIHQFIYIVLTYMTIALYMKMSASRRPSSSPAPSSESSLPPTSRVPRRVGSSTTTTTTSVLPSSSSVLIPSSSSTPTPSPLSQHERQSESAVIASQPAMLTATAEQAQRVSTVMTSSTSSSTHTEAYQRLMMHSPIARSSLSHSPHVAAAADVDNMLANLVGVRVMRMMMRVRQREKRNVERYQ